MKRPFLALGLFLLSLNAVHAQKPAAKNEDKPLSITPEQRQHAILTLAKEFDERYVFPDVAKKVKESLESRLKEGGYNEINTGQELAKVMTKEIQEITKDKHVRMNCSTEKLPKQQPRSEPSAEEMKRMRERQKARNAAFVKVERLPGNIGYLRLDAFMDPEAGRDPLLGAMTFLKNTDALILDLRYNGGGTPLMIRDLCSYFFDATPVHINSMYFRKDNRREEFWTHKEVPGPRYLNKDVYVLTSAYTFSGGEECAYNFQTQKRGTLIGEVTGGGAHPGGMVPIADHYMIFIPTGRAINPVTGTNWEGVGVKPDVLIDADKALDHAQELAQKKLLDSKNESDKTRWQRDLEMEKMSAKRVEDRRQENIKSRQNKQ